MCVKMSDSKDHAGERSDKLVDSSDKKSIYCAHCKKNVLEAVLCIKCKEIFHRSCLITAAKKRNANCIHETKDEINLEIQEEDNPQFEIKLLRTKVKFLEDLLMESRSKNDILMLNNELLLEKIRANEKHEGKQTKKNVYIEGRSYAASTVNGTSEINPITENSYQLQTTQKQQKTRTDVPKVVQNDRSHLTSKQGDRKYTTEVKMVSESNAGSHLKSIRNDTFKESEWQTVVNKRRSKQSNTRKIICTGTKSDESLLQGVKKRKWIYLGKVVGKTITEEDVMSYMKKTKDIKDVQVRRLQTKGENSAFTVGVLKEEDFEAICNGDFWPEGIIVGEFRFENFFRRMNRISSNT